MTVAMLGSSYNPYTGRGLHGDESDTDVVDKSGKISDYFKAVADTIENIAVGVASAKYAKPDAPAEPSFFEKNQPLIIGGIAVVGVLILVGAKKRRRR